MHWIFLLLTALLFAEEKVSTHFLQLENSSLSYSAVVNSLPAKNHKGEVKGEISYIAYFVKEESRRPITFVFNGGPGSSSVWLHLGAFGPRRILAPEEGQSTAPPYSIIDNCETLLDLTDLVFIDPVGTGLSHANTPEDAKDFYDSFGDVNSIATFIVDFLTANKRWNCPIYLAGESYGTYRACGLADYLQSEFGLYLNGLILISCAIDFQTIFFDNDNFLPDFLFLPTYATTAWYHGRYARPEATLEEVAEEARAFAYEIYAPALLRHSRMSSAEWARLYEQLSSMTSLSMGTIKRAQGKIDSSLFSLEFFPEEKKVLGRYDTRVVGPYFYVPFFSQDPSVASVEGIFSGTLHYYLQAELNCPVSYKIFSMEANEEWNHRGYLPFGYPNFMDGLRQALIANPRLKVFVGSGYFDAVTPFAATEYCFDHLHLADSYRDNLQMEYYEGGHMYYLNPAARKKFKQDLVRFFAK